MNAPAGRSHESGDYFHVGCPHCGTINRVSAARARDGAICGQCRNRLFAGHPVELTEASFARVVDHTDIPVIVDFWAPWCGPCRAMAPQFERATQALEPEFRLAKVNTEDAPRLAQTFGIRSIPTIVMLVRGREVARQSGAMDADRLARWARSQAKAAA